MFTPYENAEIENSRRNSFCKKCLCLISKGKKRVFLLTANRYGQVKLTYHPECFTDLIADYIERLENTIRKMNRACGLTFE